MLYNTTHQRAYRAPIYNISTKRAQSPTERPMKGRKGTMAQTIELSSILQMNPLERSLNYAGSSVWIWFPDRYAMSMAEGTLRNFLEPLHREETKTRQHWKVQKGIKPITLKVFLNDTREVVTVHDYDFEMEYLGTVVSLFGESNVKVTPASVDIRKKGR